MYTTEKNLALEFISNHGTNPAVIAAIEEASETGMSHSDRWSIYFDMMLENFISFEREKRGKIVVGLAYLTDEGKI